VYVATVSPSSGCTPGDRTFCYNHGYCNSAGNGCDCDDPFHYWPSDQCIVAHEGPQLEAGQCCMPGATDAYCSYTGTCNANGRWCDCISSIRALFHLAHRTRPQP
jgi:hypothetical protein